MWRQSYCCNHSTIKYSTFSPLLQVEKRGWIWRQEVFGHQGVTAFFDVRVTHVNSRSNQLGKYTATIFKEQENEKKRKYNQRVMDVEVGTFTPLVFGTNGGMGLDRQNFLRTLANKLSTKNNEPYASVISWLRMQYSCHLLYYELYTDASEVLDIHSNHVRSQKTSLSL